MTVSSDPRVPCWDRSCNCYGTAKIFERRANAFRRRLATLAWLGIGVPFALGTAVLAWGKDLLEHGWVLALAIALGVAQAVLSLAALVGRWTEELEYSNESMAANFRLSDDFQRLAQRTSLTPDEFDRQFDQLVERDAARVQQDIKRHISEPERRRGHRHGLIQFRRTCAGCDAQPQDLNPSNCTVCGDFGWILTRKWHAFSKATSRSIEASK